MPGGLAITLLGLVLLSCGKSGPTGGGGVDPLGPYLVGGGYYIVGSCVPTDSADNVISHGDGPGTLRSTSGRCRGAPYVIDRHRTATGWASTVTVGPLPEPYVSLSVPLDLSKRFTAFEFAAPGYFVGCDSAWTPRGGTGDAYAAIPTPCEIPGVGLVGLARTGPVAWMEARGSARIRRTLLAGNVAEAAAYRHPGTHNLTWDWVRSGTSDVLPAGTTWTVTEEITVQ